MAAIDPDLLLRAYAIGVFPMSDSRDADDVFWVEPRRRAILPLERFRVSRSLRKTIRSGEYRVTRDTAFAEVVQRCAERDETWINSDIERSEEHTSELQSQSNLVCRLLLEKKKNPAVRSTASPTPPTPPRPPCRSCAYTTPRRFAARPGRR